MEMRGMIAAGTVVLLAGCGGGGASLGTGSNGATAGGIWRGTESVSGLGVVGIVNESGNFTFVRSDGVQYIGTATVSGTSVTANVEGIVPLGFTFADGSHHGTGTISGTIQARQALDASTKFTTDLGNASTGTLNLTFDALYNLASSLNTISGNYTNTANNVVVTVGTNGSIFSQDSTSGCVLNGTVSIINASYNAYNVTFDYASCTGQFSRLNGISFTGMAMLDNTATPEQIVVAATGTASGTKYSVVLKFNKT
jgi:hypothetical protein